MLGRPALMVAGEDAVKLFCDQDVMVREGAVPAPLSDELFGAGTIHGLDGAIHAHRKATHLAALDEDEVSSLTHALARSWDQVVGDVRPRPGDELFDVVVEALGAAALDWAGVGSTDASERSRDLMRIVDGFGSVGPRHLRGRRARRRCEAWARSAIREARTHEGTAPVDRVAAATDTAGELLSEEVAAVELLNLVRPLVAVAYFAAFIPVALRERPDWRGRVDARGDDVARRAFVHELRRHYPFVPMLAARSVRDVDWHGHRIRRGQRVLLHVVATNHDPRLWEAPWSFRPERFEGIEPGPYEFVPQGGGDVHRGHRCPGESAVVEALIFLTRHIAGWPDEGQELTFDTTRMPTHPRVASARR
ncbi:MAG: cytochrome P450 [Janibacter sp.]